MRGWDEKRRTYMCVNGASVLARKELSESGIVYKTREKLTLCGSSLKTRDLT